MPPCYSTIRGTPESEQCGEMDTMNVVRDRTRLDGTRWYTNTTLHSEGGSSDSIRPLSNCQFKLTRTVREHHASGCPCTHCVHCVGFVRYIQTTSGCVISGRERYTSGWRCSVNARVDASGSPTKRHLLMSAD